MAWIVNVYEPGTISSGWSERSAVIDGVDGPVGLEGLDGLGI